VDEVARKGRKARFDAVVVPTVLRGLLAMGRFGEDAMHGLGGGGKEVAAAVNVLIAAGTQVRFMSESSGIEAEVGGFCRRKHGGEGP
jgi:hypothetical protein